MNCKKTLLAMVLTALLFSPAQGVGAMARQGPAFDQATVAKRYNFSFTGEGGGKIFSIIGWFEANDSDASGNIFAGSAEASMAEGAAFTTVSLPLSSSVLSRIRVKDAANGIYSLFLKFDEGPNSVALDVRLILDDSHGRRGKMSGFHSSALSVLMGGGVGSGEITAR